ncbi:MAG: terminase large subunit domain-containing protein, partial [Chloroflexota bacterium]
VKLTPFGEVSLVNGSSIHARTAGQDGGVKARGREADRVVIDEAAYVPGRVITDVVGPFMATSDHAELILISTPFGRNHFSDYFERGQAGVAGHRSFQFPTATHPGLRPGYLEEQRAQMTDLAYRVEYLAEFAEDQNAVFPWSLIESCLSDLPRGPRPNRQYVIGYDPAKYSDRSGVAVVDVTESPYALAEILDISGRDYLTQTRIISELSATYHAPVLLDATSHDQLLEQLLADGIEAEGYRFSNESKRELIDGLVLTLEQHGLLLYSDSDLLDELKYYRYQLTAAGNVRLGATESHHDDLVTALALAVQLARSPRDAGMLLAGFPTPAVSGFAARLKRRH